MSRRPPGAPKFDRPKQECPADLVAALLGVIRSSFYPDSFSDKAAAKQWFSDQHFLKVRVVLWPASWLDGKGVSLSTDRYREIMMEVVNEIKAHGQTGAVKFWPGYLAKCVQDHFHHQGEKYYAEGKNLRTIVERALIAGRPRETPSVDPIRALAEARLDILDARRKRKVATLPPPKAKSGQLDLF